MNSRLALGFSCKKCFLAPLSGLLTIIFLVACGHLAFGQQTLGSINGEVTDSSGAVIQRAQVKARATATNLEVTATTKADGSFNIADLPIGTYEVKFIKDGFETDVHPQILVQGNRTATISSTKTITWTGSREAQGSSAYCLFAPVRGKLPARGNFIEQDSYDHTVRVTLLLRNCLRINVHGALDGCVPEQFLLHLDVGACTSQHR